MNREVISDKQGIALMILFIIGTAIITVSATQAKRDMWIAIILSLLVALFIALVFVRIHYTFPGKNLFDICEICFGKFIGKGIVILFTWFIFHTGVLVLMNLNLFINTVSLSDTPQIVTMISITLLCSWIVKKGIEVMGRWAKFFLIIFIGLIVITIVLLIPTMNINNIKPVLNEGIKPILIGAFGTFGFPFTQIMVFTMAFFGFQTKKSPYKIYIKGLLIGGIAILLISLTNLLVLGKNYTFTVYYPSHTSAARIVVGKIMERVEIIISTGFVLGAFIKGSIYLLAASKGITKIFGCSDYRFIVIPISLLMINLSHFLHDSLMDYFYFVLRIWIYYALPFQVLLPIIIWIIAEIKNAA